MAGFAGGLLTGLVTGAAGLVLLAALTQPPAVEAPAPVAVAPAPAVSVAETAAPVVPGVADAPVALAEPAPEPQTPPLPPPARAGSAGTVPPPTVPPLVMAPPETAAPRHDAISVPAPSAFDLAAASEAADEATESTDTIDATESELIAPESLPVEPAPANENIDAGAVAANTTDMPVQTLSGQIGPGPSVEEDGAAADEAAAMDGGDEDGLAQDGSGLEVAKAEDESEAAGQDGEADGLAAPDLTITPDNDASTHPAGEPDFSGAADLPEGEATEQDDEAEALAATDLTEEPGNDPAAEGAVAGHAAMDPENAGEAGDAVATDLPEDEDTGQGGEADALAMADLIGTPEDEAVAEADGSAAPDRLADMAVESPLAVQPPAAASTAALLTESGARWRYPAPDLSIPPAITDLFIPSSRTGGQN